MRSSIVILSFALQLLAAPLPRSPELAVEKRDSDLFLRLAEPEPIITHPSNGGGNAQRPNQDRHAEPEPIITHPSTGEGITERPNHSREVPELEIRYANAKPQLTYYTKGGSSEISEKPHGDRREAVADPQLVYYPDGESPETTEGPRNGRKREAEPLSHTPGKRLTKHEAEDAGIERNKLMRSIGFRSIYKSMAGTIEALRARGFSSSQLLEPN